MQKKIFRFSLECAIIGFVLTGFHLWPHIEFSNYNIYYSYMNLLDIIRWHFFCTLYPILCGILSIVFSTLIKKINTKLNKLFFLPFILGLLPFILLIFKIIYGIQFYCSTFFDVALLFYLLIRAKHIRKNLFSTNITSKGKLWVNCIFITLVMSLTTFGLLQTVKIFSDFRFFVPKNIFLNLDTFGKSCNEIESILGQPHFKYIEYETSLKESVLVLFKEGTIKRIYSRNYYIKIGDTEKKLKKLGFKSLSETWIYSYIPFEDRLEFNSITFIDGKVRNLPELW